MHRMWIKTKRVSHSQTLRDPRHTDSVLAAWFSVQVSSSFRAQTRLQSQIFWLDDELPAQFEGEAIFKAQVEPRE